MKKNQVNKVTEAKKLKKLRLSRETLHTLTSSENQRVVGGISEDCGGATSPIETQCGSA
jgi:hypothetical protein